MISAYRPLQNKPKNIAVCVSGRGSNLRALWYYAQSLGQDCAFNIATVAADSPCPALDFARENDIDCQILDAADRMIQRDSRQKIAENTWLQKIDFIALAGFMQIIRPAFLVDWDGRVINIHPSLLPKFKGLGTHARAIAAQETHHGCSVHLVDQGIDTGKLLAQARLAIHPHDTPESLQSRVLRMEHALYGQVLQQFCLNPRTNTPALHYLEDQLAVDLGQTKK